MRTPRARVLARATQHVALSLAFSLIVVGCSEPGAGPAPITVNLSTWQHAVERYIEDQGNGDPNILRDTTLPTSQPGFALMGEADVSKSTDADGLLLGHRYIDGRPWFIFLVGLVKSDQLDDVRLVALSHEADRNVWQMSEPDPGAVETYRKSSETPVAPYIAFPAPADQFSVQIDGSTIQVQHNPSGAKWRLDLAPK